MLKLVNISEKIIKLVNIEINMLSVGAMFEGFNIMKMFFFSFFKNV
jgi:hypothetical protein